MAFTFKLQTPRNGTFGSFEAFSQPFKEACESIANQVGCFPEDTLSNSNLLITPSSDVFVTTFCMDCNGKIRPFEIEMKKTEEGYVIPYGENLVYPNPINKEVKFLQEPSPAKIYEYDLSYWEGKPGPQMTCGANKTEVKSQRVFYLGPNTAGSGDQETVIIGVCEDGTGADLAGVKEYLVNMEYDGWNPYVTYYGPWVVLSTLVVSIMAFVIVRYQKPRK